ncbi:MAG: hypothetical protein ACRBBO_01460 [Cognatishimia sp.]
MRKPFVSALIATTLITLTACATPQSPNLTSAELNALVTGNSFNYSGSLQGHRFSGEMTFNENYNLFVSTNSGAPEGGTWRIKDNTLCTRLVSLRNGQENCFSVQHVSEGKYVTSHGFTIFSSSKTAKVPST